MYIKLGSCYTEKNQVVGKCACVTAQDRALRDEGVKAGGVLRGLESGASAASSAANGGCEWNEMCIPTMDDGNICKTIYEVR